MGGSYEEKLNQSSDGNADADVKVHILNMTMYDIRYKHHLFK